MKYLIAGIIVIVGLFCIYGTGYILQDYLHHAMGNRFDKDIVDDIALTFLLGTALAIAVGVITALIIRLAEEING